MKAMILAAGRGERMRPLTDTVPKPLLPVAGKPLLQYHLEGLAAAGVNDVVINLAWLGERIRACFGCGERFGVRIHYSEEGDFALETGGGIFQALPQLGPDPFIVVSGDVWTEFPWASLRSRLATGDMAHLVVVPNPPFHARGDFAIAENRLVPAGDRYTYANIGVFRPEFFAGCRPGRFAVGPLMHAWIDQGRVSGELFTGRWRNVGTPAQLAELDAELRSR